MVWSLRREIEGREGREGWVGKRMTVAYSVIVLCGYNGYTMVPSQLQFAPSS